MKSSFIVAILLFGSLFAFAPHRANPSSGSPASDQGAILVGAGDIADCKDLSGAEATAKLLDQIPGTVMVPGDLAYPGGSREDFTCYDKTWGRAKFRTRPAPATTSLILRAPRRTSIILAPPPVTQRPATTATNSAPGTSSC